MGLFDPKTAPLSERAYAADAWKQLSKGEREKESMRMAIHAAMVDSIDQNVGRLVKKLEATGMQIIELDMSAVRKMDGGLTCLSLRF